MPFSSDDMESPDEFWHIPLMSIGDVQGNKNLCRISIEHTNPSTLYVAFRPLNLDGLDKMLKKTSYLELSKKYIKMKDLELTEAKSIDNIIHLSHCLDDVKTFVDLGISESLSQEIMRGSNSATIENWFSSLAKLKKYMEGIMKNKHLFADGNKLSYGVQKTNISILNMLVSFIYCYKPKEVVFWDLRWLYLQHI